MFIKIVETICNDEVIINTDSISHVYIAAKTIVMNGVHGGGNGLLHVNDVGMSRLLAAIEEQGKKVSKIEKYVGLIYEIRDKLDENEDMPVSERSQLISDIDVKLKEIELS